MNPVLTLARPEILTLKPYAHASWLPALTRMHANEAPWRPTGDKTAAGLNRYQLDLPACPFSFDVLDGAILAAKDSPVCVFQERKCRFSPGGMWGPAATELGPDRVKELERSRASAYTAEEADFRALVARAPDRSEVKKIAAQQAAFSSEREEACRSYAGESVHGFCATRFTEAKIAVLQALLGSPDAPSKKRPGKASRGSADAARPKPLAGDTPTDDTQ